jgi:hypothetical protein
MGTRADQPQPTTFLSYGQFRKREKSWTLPLNGPDPEAYLRHVFSRIADHPITRIEELLPWNVAAHLQPAKAAQLSRPPATTPL